MGDLGTLIINSIIVLTVVLIGLKLTGHISCPWSWVYYIILAPIVILVVTALIAEGIGAIRTRLHRSEDK
jgi:cytochrome c oxidase subunit IV